MTAPDVTRRDDSFLVRLDDAPVAGGSVHDGRWSWWSTQTLGRRVQARDEADAVRSALHSLTTESTR